MPMADNFISVILVIFPYMLRLPARSRAQHGYNDLHVICFRNARPGVVKPMVLFMVLSQLYFLSN